MARGRKKSQKSESKQTTNDAIADLKKRLAELESQTKTESKAKTSKKSTKKATKKSTKKAEEKAEETWKTVGKASETVEDAQAYQKRVSVQVQKSSEGREQVHIYTQVLIPKDKLRASAKGLSKQKAKTSDGKTVDSYWINQRNPIVIRGNKKDAVSFLSSLIKKARK